MGNPAGELDHAGVNRHCQPDADGIAFLENAASRLGLSARAYHRILKLAGTISDLEGASAIGQPHLAEAVHYRRLGLDFQPRPA